MEAVAALIIYSGLFVALVVPAIILRGWVLSILWDWFIVPLGVVDIGIAWAIGISAVVGLLTSASHNTGEESIGTGLSKLFLSPLFVLLVAWIVHGFM